MSNDNRSERRVPVVQRWRVEVTSPTTRYEAEIANVSRGGVALRVDEALRIRHGEVILLDVRRPDGSRVDDDVPLVVLGEARDRRGRRLLRGRFAEREGARIVRDIWRTGAEQRAA